MLESGILVIFLIPGKISGEEYTDSLSATVRELVRWLAFRVFFSNGAGKLLSGNERWFDLSAVDI